MRERERGTFSKDECSEKRRRNEFAWSKGNTNRATEVINWFLKIKDDDDGDRRVINKRSVDGRCSQDYRFTPFSL